MSKDKRKEPIPEHFNGDEKAGRFWDTHSASDYWDTMKETELEFDVQKRTFLVPVNARIYQIVKKQAEVKRSTVEKIINNLLAHDLVRTR